MNSLAQIAKQMVAPGKGILAADESSSTCQKRFESVGVPCTEENRRAYRETLLTADGLEQYISGIILYDETIRQETSEGEAFAAVLEKKGILPGVKVDTGPKELALHAGEKITEGLDGLRERLLEYKSLGARFAKWRAVINIGKDMPSEACIHANAHAMARYAALCQEADIVPMVEPEMMIDGDHTIDRCYEVSVAMLRKTFEELAGQNVAVEGIILKTSMVIAGKKAAQQASMEEVAKETIRAFKETLPADLAGIAFLSGGQSDEQATEHLNAMNKAGTSTLLGASKLPWPLSFSYGRAIQNPVLKIWAESPNANVGKAQEALLFRSKMNALATQGKYSSDMEKGRPY